jgi:hypothetical protein
MLKVHLFKVSLDERLYPDSKSTASAVSFPLFPFDPRRAHLLESCLSAIESLTTSLFSLPPQSLLSLPYPFWGPAGHMMLILSRLSDVHHGAWNPTYVSSTLDFQTTCRRFVAKLEEVVAVGKEMTPPRYLPEMFLFMITKFKELGGLVGGLVGGESEVALVAPELGPADFIWDDWMMNGIFTDLFDAGMR